MKYKINCYLKEIPNFLKEINNKTNGVDYIDIKNDFGKTLFMIQCNIDLIDLENFKKYIDYSKPYNIWKDTGKYFYEKIVIKP
jgi:hypothetical protein